MKEITRGESPKQSRFSAAIWAVQLIWQTSPALVTGMLISTFVRGVVPAGFALAVRGLINSVTEAIAQQQAGLEAAYFWLAISLAITVVDIMLVLAGKLFSDYLRNDLTLEVNSMVMRHSSSLDLPYLENAENRELLNRVRQNPASRLQSMFTSGINSALSIIQVASLVALLTWLEPLILLVAPIVVIPFMVFHWRLARVKYLTEYHRTRDRRWSAYFLSKVTSQDTIAEVKQLGLGELLAQRFIATLEGFREQDRKLQLRQFGGGAVFSVITISAFYLLFARVVFQVLEGALTIGDMAVFAGAVARLRAALQTSIRSAAQTYEQTLYIADLRKFLDSEPQVRNSDRTIRDPVEGELSVENVSFTYPGSSEVVLHDVSLYIGAGEKVALVGENGSGKSTLAKLLIRLYDADSGRISIDHKPIASYELSHLHSRVALLSQTFGRYEASMAENIAYGDWDRLSNNREAIEQIATQTALDRIAEQLPDGLDTRLGRQFSEHDLSAGQWQLLAIARTLARDASVLILDEPTSNIDVRSEYELFQAIEQMSAGLTTIIISHRFSTIRMMDRILVMHEGRIVEEGSHDDLMSAGGKYKSLYTMHEHYRAADPEWVPG